MRSFYIEKEWQFLPSLMGSNWAYESYGVEGDLVAAFVGPGMDWSFRRRLDAKSRQPVPASFRMLHFVAELFGASNRELAIFHHLLLGECLDRLGEGFYVRQGQLYYLDALLSQGQIYVGPISSVAHLGLYLESDPKQAASIGIIEFDVPVRDFAVQVMQGIVAQWNAFSQQARDVRLVS